MDLLDFLKEIAVTKRDETWIRDDKQIRRNFRQGKLKELIFIK